MGSFHLWAFIRGPKCLLPTTTTTELDQEMRNVLVGSRLRRAFAVRGIAVLRFIAAIYVRGSTKTLSCSENLLLAISVHLSSGSAIARFYLSEDSFG